MAEYMDRQEFYNTEKLLDTDIVRKSKTASWLMDQFLHDIKAHPAADVAPVVHGKWVPEHHRDAVSPTEYHEYTWYYCSRCGRRLIGYTDPTEAPYCHCGARMDEEDTNA